MKYRINHKPIRVYDAQGLRPAAFRACEKQYTKCLRVKLILNINNIGNRYQLFLKMSAKNYSSENDLNLFLSVLSSCCVVCFVRSACTKKKNRLVHCLALFYSPIFYGFYSIFCDNGQDDKEDSIQKTLN